MQKKIIALAVAGLMSGAAFAQSNVTVYGLLDAGYARISSDGDKTQSNIDGGLMSGSRLGFRGSEDLGGGLKAIFTLEYALANDLDTGVGANAAGWSATQAARQQLVGLTGNFGTVVLGRAQTTAYDWACAYTGPLAGGSFDSSSKLAATTTLTCGNAGRASNAFAYVSPSFSGLTVAYNHARLTETAGTTTPLGDNNAHMFSANYVNGPMAAGLVYTAVEADTTAAADDVKEWGLGGSYDLGLAKMFASYQRTKTEGLSADNKWQLGVSVKAGANGSVAFSYSDSKIKSTAANDDSKAFGLAYIHTLSKRTNAYVGYSRISNDGTAVRGIKGIAPTAGGDASVLGVGMRHSF